MSQPTSELTIGALSGEILIKVFRYLYQHDLMNATLTCKFWHYMIESSCRWSISLNRNCADAEWLKFMQTTNRKFGNMNLLFTDPLNSNQMQEIFQRHGFNVVKLQLDFHGIGNYFIQFAELFKLMPNLSDVYIFRAETDIAPLEQDLPELKKLKKLKICRSADSTLKLFHKSKPTTLDVSWLKQPLESLHDFLHSQNILTKLKIDFVDIILTPMPFQLTHLSLFGMRLQTLNDYKNLVEFLKRQAKTLIELELGSDFPDFVYKFVFASMTSLKTWSLGIEDLPQNKAFYEQLEENRSITTLTFVDPEQYYHNNDEFPLPDFLKKLPNIESVISEDFSHETLLAMAQCLTKIESLCVDISGNESNGVRFPNLKRFEVKHLNGNLNWNQFTKSHTQLTELTIEKILNKSYINNSDIDQITSNVSLQSLRLGVGFVADKQFVDIIRRKCTHLKVLDLSKTCIIDEVKDNIDCNVLRLCDAIKSTKN